MTDPLFNNSISEAQEERYLTEQLITYLGNKRSLLNFIGQGLERVQTQLDKDKLDILDLFSGSGVVSRYFKRYAANLYVNDLESYCRTINSCYLANKSTIDMPLLQHYHNLLTSNLCEEDLKQGFIAQLYAPKDDKDIQQGERVFYTTRNAKYIDTARQLISSLVPNHLQHFFIAPLLTEASIKNNTSGVFKGFYKNSYTGIGQFGGNNQDALKRIKGDIHLPLPIFSEYECNTTIYQQDANALVASLPHIDLVYIDPPYNQHPYGSNYFMLNLINDYTAPTNISNISGIPKGWNKSSYNKKAMAYTSLHDLCTRLDTDFILISFNSEGFIVGQQMLDMLQEVGQVTVIETQYNAYRASRNLHNRSIHTKEYLYLVDKRK